MLWPIFVSLIVILAATAYQHTKKRSIHRRGEKLRCGPATLPVLGNAVKFLQPRHLLFEWFVQCHRRFGFETFAISIPSLPAGVVISDPENLEYVLKNESTITKGEFFRRRSWDLFGHGIINSDGELWKIQRKAGLKFFTGSNLETLIEAVLPSAYTQTRSVLLQHAQSGDSLDLEAIFLDLTTMVVGRMAYDMDISGRSPFSQAFDYASDQTGRRFQNPLYPITELFAGAKFRTSLAEVKKFGHEIVSRAQTRRIQAREVTGTSNDGFGSLVNSLMDALDSEPALTADAALNFLSAGRDTTAQSLTWTLYSLLRHPLELDSLRKEIDSAFPQQQIQQQQQHQPSDRLPTVTVADLQPSNLPTTMSIFNESLRLYPPVPFEIKQCQQDTTLPDGTFLPSGSIIVWCIWAMNRSREIWGDDSDHFRPDRWLTRATTGSLNDDDDGGGGARAVKAKVAAKSPFEFPVFNAGPRSCLGKKMAEVMACWVLMHICAEFDFEEILDRDDDGKASSSSSSSNNKKERRGRRTTPTERRSKNSLTLPMEGGLPCYVRLRNL